MTIEFAYLQGDFESPEETLRKLCYDEWDTSLTQDETPKMISPLGFDDEEAKTEAKDQNSTNDWIAAKRGEYIRFKYTDTVQQKSDDLDNTHIRKNYIVQIDVFSTNSLRSALFREQVEDILFENQPNSSKRIKKSNGETSGIVTFDRQALEWLEIGTFEEMGLVREWQAEIGCLFQKNKT